MLQYETWQDYCVSARCDDSLGIKDPYPSLLDPLISYFDIMNVGIVALTCLLFMLGVSAHGTIFSGTGFGTYYYDVRQVEACGTSFAAQNSGPLECSPQKALSLDHVNSNYVVAMNHSQLILDMSKYCGKRVVVTVNGKQSNLPLFIGDGCERCAGGSASSDIWNAVGAPGLDFSYSVLEELSGGAACADGHVQISWEIVDDTIYSFSDDASSRILPAVASIEQSTSSSALAMSTSASAAMVLHTPATDDPVQNPVGSPTLGTCTGATDSRLSGPCPTGAWRCNGSVLEQCLTDRWTPRITCGAAMTCQGGSHPYCVQTPTFIEYLNYT